jgi:hypothetical protein
MNADKSITDILASEAEATEQGRDLDAEYVPSRKRSKDPSQVYSVRLPVDRLEELRQLASREHVAPSALLRRWALERLDRELDHASRVAEARETHESAGTEALIMTRGQFEIEFNRYVSENADMIAAILKTHGKK